VRVLHLTPELPCWPGGTGGATRQFHLLRRLVELGHEVTVVAPVPWGQEDRRAVLSEAGIRLEGVGRPASRVRETLDAVAAEPRLAADAAVLPVLAWQVGVFWTYLRPLARRTLAEWKPDVVTIEHDNAASWVEEVPPAVPAALVLQNVGWHYYESRAAAAAGPAAAGLRLEAARFRRHHARWFGRYRTLIAVSERDRADLRRVTSTPVGVVPNGVASDELRPVPPSSEPATLLFTGTLSHPPNAEGIRWFADAVWPQVRSERPGVRLVVVGRDPPRGVLELGDRDGVEVVGPVPQMAPWFERATAVVAPLLSGGGTRLKILEALACRRATVSTSVGCEGLELSSERELLVADGAAAFAEATLRLLTDRELRERLAAAGRDAVERVYDWRVLGDRLAAVLTDVAENA
jgi:glycosyltransferase involved in cell wall biosynthesis